MYLDIYLSIYLSIITYYLVLFFFSVVLGFEFRVLCFHQPWFCLPGGQMYLGHPIKFSERVKF
jgi:hypothetical protein